MNKHELDAAIAACRTRSMPAVPEHLKADVLRRIRTRAAGRETDAPGWLDALLAPRTATALFALMLAATLSVAAMTSLSNSGTQRRELAAQTLHLTDFAPSEIVNFSR